MVMIFESEKALKYLLRKGLVFSFRRDQRKKLEKDWITKHRTGTAIADVWIELEKGTPSLSHLYGKLDKDLLLYIFLRPYIDKSGFKTVKEWIDEIKRLNHGVIPMGGWLYKITLIKRR